MLSGLDNHRRSEDGNFLSWLASTIFRESFNLSITRTIPAHFFEITGPLESLNPWLPFHAYGIYKFFVVTNPLTTYHCQACQKIIRANLHFISTTKDRFLFQHVSSWKSTCHKLFRLSYCRCITRARPIHDHFIVMKKFAYCRQSILRSYILLSAIRPFNRQSATVPGVHL